MATALYWQDTANKTIYGLVNQRTINRSQVAEVVDRAAKMKKISHKGDHHEWLHMIGHNASASSYPHADNVISDVGKNMRYRLSLREQRGAIAPCTYVFRTEINSSDKDYIDGADNEASFYRAVEPLIKGLTTIRMAAKNQTYQRTGQYHQIGSLNMAETVSVTAEDDSTAPWEFDVDDVTAFPVGSDFDFRQANGTVISNGGQNLPYGRIVNTTTNLGAGKIMVIFPDYVSGTFTIPIDAMVCLPNSFDSATMPYQHGLDEGVGTGAFPRNEAGNKQIDTSTYKSIVKAEPGKIKAAVLRELIEEMTDLARTTDDPTSAEYTDFEGNKTTRATMVVCMNRKHRSQLSQAMTPNFWRPLSPTVNIETVFDQNHEIAAVFGVPIMSSPDWNINRIFGLNMAKWVKWEALPLHFIAPGVDGSPFRPMSGTMNFEAVATEKEQLFPLDRAGQFKITGDNLGIDVDAIFGQA